jgi:ComF family protein
MGRLPLARAARALAAEALDALYPPLCWLCRRARAADGLACAEHAFERRPAAPSCRRCARALAPALPDESLCARCRQRSPGYRRLIALGRYRSAGALAEWILALKHGGRRELALPLGTLLGARWRELGAAPGGAVLVPVPLHVLRRVERGYDQADLLARAAAEEARLECCRALARVRWTPPQGSSAAAPRGPNVSGAFRARRQALAALERRPVVLVDDVVTSGATIEACAAALRAADVREIWVLCLARADDDP